MGKGHARRKGANDKNYDKGYDKIDHSKKSADHKEPEGKKVGARVTYTY